ncbi:MerR family DNA-binding transcriptional regulator, partial [Streptomyces brasiliscabiei]
MKIAEFEKQTGLSRDTLRYYEKIGMLTPPIPAGNGYRYYGQTQLQE